jgi:hypothetical protein
MSLVRTCFESQLCHSVDQTQYDPRELMEHGFSPIEEVCVEATCPQDKRNLDTTLQTLKLKLNAVLVCCL